MVACGVLPLGVQSPASLIRLAISLKCKGVPAFFRILMAVDRTLMGSSYPFIWTELLFSIPLLYTNCGLVPILAYVGMLGGGYLKAFCSFSVDVSGGQHAYED